MKRVLFVCSRNRLRSPTAEQVFAAWPGVETASAGTDHDAEVALTPELVRWAELIFVMETTHRDKLRRRFREALRGQRIVCLNIPDEFAFQQPELVALLKRKVPPHLMAR